MNLKKLLITLAKIAASLGIIGWLFYSALNTPDGRDAFVKMLKQDKAWGLLIGGFATLLLAVVITLVRWWYLVRALGIDFSLRDALRIGFIGCLFNLAPMGIAGGDLLKAWMLAREKPGNRAKALASVVVDRIVGLYVLFLVAAAGVFITGLWDIPTQPSIGFVGSAHCHLRFHGGDRAGLDSRISGRAVGELADADTEDRCSDRKSAAGDPNLP